MTKLDKQVKVRAIMHQMCAKQDCMDCEFFDVQKTGSSVLCAIVDKNNHIPVDEDWDINSALFGD